MGEHEGPSAKQLLVSCDAERRRLERDLHDGAQQRLAAVAATLALARRRAESGDEDASDLLESAATETQRSLEELRDLARRIYPTVVADRGLGPALRDLARRAAVPTQVVEAPEHRFPAPVEVTLYLVASTAIADALEHAGATGVAINARVEGDRVVLEVTHDGSRERPALSDLAARVIALGGELRVSSAAQGHTLVWVSVPTDL